MPGQAFPYLVKDPMAEQDRTEELRRRQLEIEAEDKLTSQLVGLEEKVNKVMTDRSKPDSVAIVSGGLDSTTLVYHMLRKGYIPHLLSFNYGQRHIKELTYAGMTAMRLGLRHDVVDLSGITHLISNSALTSPNRPYVGDNTDGSTRKRDIEVPDGHYAEESMKATVVPNRNMIMISIAAGLAVNNKYRTIALGVHGGDHFIYPDCRPEFLDHAATAIEVGNEGFHNFQQSGSLNPFELGGSCIYAPYLEKSKTDIAYEALKLGVPLHLTWSCYKGSDIHCGRCGTCVERLEAISEAEERLRAEGFLKDQLNSYDHTVYADDEFWKTVEKEN